MSTHLRILFVGNSYIMRNDLPQLIAQIGAADDKPATFTSDRVVAGGASLRRHWNAGVAAEKIHHGQWDVVVLQEQSTLPLKNRTRFHENVREFANLLAAKPIQLVLYMTWARRDAPEQQAALTEAYAAIGDEIGAAVAPVGQAWAHVLAQHPDITLHDADGSHPTLAGSYLAACVFYQTLRQRSAAHPVVGLQLPESLQHTLAAAAQTVAGDGAGVTDSGDG